MLCAFRYGGTGSQADEIGDVGAVPVCKDRQDRKLVGIVTDRDLVVNIMAEGRDPNTTMVQDVMTREPFAC